MLSVAATPPSLLALAIQSELSPDNGTVTQSCDKDHIQRYGKTGMLFRSELSVQMKGTPVSYRGDVQTCVRVSKIGQIAHVADARIFAWEAHR